MFEQGWCLMSGLPNQIRYSMDKQTPEEFIELMMTAGDNPYC